MWQSAWHPTKLLQRVLPSSAGRDGYVFLTTVISPARTCFPSRLKMPPQPPPLHDAQNDWTRKLPDFSSAPSHGPLTSSAYSPSRPRATFHLPPHRPSPRLCVRRPPLRPPRLRPPLHPSHIPAPSAASPLAAPRVERQTALPHPRHQMFLRPRGAMPLPLLLATTLLRIPPPGPGPRGAAPARNIRPRSREFDSVGVAPRRGALWRHPPLIPPTTTLAPGFTLRGARATRGSVKAAHPVPWAVSPPSPHTPLPGADDAPAAHRPHRHRRPTPSPRHVHQMRAVLLPAFRNTVRRVIIECSLDAAD
ncbi:hypothetical protein FB451DRAFT_396965 [Mycena latifolia]|nr:hypothetical protein FB451DRAFT_396965 [Mycena latifolia]